MRFYIGEMLQGCDAKHGCGAKHGTFSDAVQVFFQGRFFSHAPGHAASPCSVHLSFCQLCLFGLPLLLGLCSAQFRMQKLTLALQVSVHKPSTLTLQLSVYRF